jgi:hypothetical protein
MVFLLAGLGFALPVSAAPSVPVKCGANMERVWVYDNLTTLDVSARLKCGTSVDVLGLENGYVKVRTADGNEGYVPSDAIPSSEMAELTAAASPAPVVTVATVARPAMQPVAVAQAAPVISVRAVPADAPLIAARVNESPAPTAYIAPPAAAPAPAAPPAEQSKPVPSNVPAPAQTPAPVPNTPAVTRVAAAPKISQPSVTVASAAPIPVAAPRTFVNSSVPAVPAATSRAVVLTTTVNTAPRVNTTPSTHAASRENATLTVEAVREPMPSAAPMPATTIIKAADYTIVTKRPIASATVRKADFSDDDEDMPETTATPGEDLSNCNVFFSAYGVTPMQYKWIAGDQRKKFPGVCPAPEPSMVDFVVIFTHDMDFFTTTLPDPVHTDRNGFSDWSPVTAADSTMIPVSSLDKAHREYAWVFRVHRGSFDPANFTARRRPQFTKTESSSHASSKSIEDAMQFISETGGSQ